MTETFAELCRAADEKQRRKPIDRKLARLRKLLDDNVSLERAWHELNRRDGAPQATVEALAYQLRGGFAALSEPSARRRLFELNEAQMLELADRLTRECWGKAENNQRPPRVPPWPETEIKTLMQIWSKRS